MLAPQKAPDGASGPSFERFADAPPTSGILPELSVFRQQPGLRDRYERLILVTTLAQLDRFGEVGPDTLVFTTEWLTWRRCVARNIACVHYESMLGRWPEEMPAPEELYCWTARWVFDGDEDATLFRGVSLGRPLSTEVLQISHSFGLGYCALLRACQRFAIKSLILCDAQAIFRVWDSDTKRLLVRLVAERLGIAWQDALDPAAPDDETFQTVVGYPSPPENPWRLRVRALLAAAADLIFSCASLLRRRRPFVLWWISLLNLKGIIARAQVEKFTPVVLADFIPKSGAFMRDVWRFGGRLARLPGARLSGRDRRQIDDMVRRIVAAWRAPAPPLVQAFRQAIENRMLRTGRLHEMARLVKQYEKLFRRFDFQRVVVVDVSEIMSHIPASLAHGKAIPVDELHNGMFVTGSRNTSRCGDTHVAPLISRFLCFGEAEVEWVKDCIRAPGETIVVGYPGLDAVDSSATPAMSAGGNGRNVLVLPVYHYVSDPTAYRSDTDAYLVDTVRVLRDCGYSNVRVKLHPSMDHLPHYQAVNREFSLGAEMVIAGNALTHFEWADLVVGPLSSGAFLEATRAGKRYIAVRPPSSSVLPRFARGATVIGVPEDLRAVLRDDRRADRDLILRRFCGGVANPAQRFVDAVEGSLPSR